MTTNKETSKEESKKKQEKKEIENLKKTAEANETISEDVEDKTEEMIEKQADKEKEVEEKKAEEKTQKLEEKDKEEHKKEKEAEKKESKRKAPQEQPTDESWEPITKLGREVKQGKVKNIDEILDKNRKILEPEVVDNLINAKTELIAIGQSKGKFGGGKRRAWKQTQKTTKEGNVMTFSSMAIVGDEDGHLGMGVGRATETLPARDKALRKAKLNIMKIQRDCSSFDCSCSEKHSIPFKVKGRSGGVRVELMPAALGTGLAVADELKKVLQLAGIKDIYGRTFGSTRTTFNLVKACLEALKKTNRQEIR
ncbi:MAG TPA: 30S ribosomal protein S5 [Candidatus Nanoarchaeia archaeon]|nr:30S ribosomal protein S5 [Candidatus Nanoarchaeia archaeon]